MQSPNITSLPVLDTLPSQKLGVEDVRERPVAQIMAQACTKEAVLRQELRTTITVQSMHDCMRRCSECPCRNVRVSIIHRQPAICTVSTSECDTSSCAPCARQIWYAAWHRHTAPCCQQSF